MPEYIEREAVVARIKQIFCSDCDSYNGVRCRACLIDDALLQIEDEHAADVAPSVHGEWEDKQNPRWKAYDIRHCGVCGWNIPKSKLRNKDLHWNYCPNCGAKMDGIEMVAVGNIDTIAEEMTEE